MASGISSMLNTKLRLSGMASGLDTESMIQQLMKVERMRVDKVKQDRQRLEWKQDDYREITNLLRGFQDEFLDVLKPTNIRYASSFQKYNTSYSTPGVVTAVGGAGVSSLTHNITVSQLATAATGTSHEEVILDPTKSLNLTDTMSSLAASGVIPSSDFTLKINGKDIAITGSDTVSSLMSKVNTSQANVTLTYSTFLDKFTITSKQTGAGTITFDDTTTVDFFNSIKIATTDIVAGQDASFTLDGKASTNSNNTFSIDGVAYTLLKGGNASTTVTLTQDTDAIFNTIKNFVDKYNTLLDKINGKLGEKFYRDYPPLTDDQKSSMKDSDITLWEEKAKSGSLRDDGLLSSMVSKVRKAISDPITGITGTLASIGIQTMDYSYKGKLQIDETKLRAAIQNSPNQVIDLFTKQSSTAYSPDLTSTDRSTRDSENGIANRLSDILQDNIRTTRDSNNRKGLLLEKAGIIGDITEFNNTMTDLINKKDDAISSLLDKLYAKEDYYYKKFSAMEDAINKMNNQSSWISQQFSGK